MFPLGTSVGSPVASPNVTTELERFTNGRSRQIDFSSGEIIGTRRLETRLSSMRGYFMDEPAYLLALASGDRVVYHVCPVQEGQGNGDLHYALGVLQPGRIGPEYAMTKGHFHSRREAAEVYLILRGEGALLLEDESTGESEMIRLTENQIVYVPGHTAHRTYNLGDRPLVYVGIYPANAGHDYGSIIDRGFRRTIVATAAGPACVERNWGLPQKTLVERPHFLMPAAERKKSS